MPRINLSKIVDLLHLRNSFSKISHYSGIIFSHKTYFSGFIFWSRGKKCKNKNKNFYFLERQLTRGQHIL